MASDSDARQRGEATIAERYKRMRQELGLPSGRESDAAIEKKAREESTRAAERSARGEK